LANAAASTPVNAGVPNVTDVTRRFLMVIVCERVAPGAADPKFTFVGDAASTMSRGLLGASS
jgi:hypothetical protein